MTQPAKSQEPSMEEILASIRRIIADDDASKTSQREVDAPNAAAQPIEPPPGPSPPEPQAAEPESRIADMLAEAPIAASMDAEGAADQAPDILDLTESMAAPMPSEAAPIASDPAPQFRKIEGHSDLSFDEAMEEEPAVQSTIEEASSQYLREAAEHHDDRRGQLLSRATSAAVDSAFNSLAQTVLVQNARTLEDLVREMLRPMLKGWLDDNLPAMVERLVRAEIERVSRGRMG
jgi:cell pole-organizing protein PopZ